MANYFNLTYDADYPTGPSIQLNDTDGYQLVNGLDITISSKPTNGFTPDTMKIWGVNGVASEGAAAWQPWDPTTTGTLVETGGVQYVYMRARNAALTSDAIATSSGIEFSWSDPTIHSSVGWKDDFQSLRYESASVAVLENATDQTEVTLEKSNINGLQFSGKNFSDIIVQNDRIVGSDSSYIGGLLYDPDSKIHVKKVFTGDQTPMIMVDSGSGFVTLTTFSGAVKSTITGDYTGRVDNVVWTEGTKTLEFDIFKFSTYGFTTVNALEFTTDSMEGGYNGNPVYLKVEVKDDNGDTVENAPVTFSGVSGDNIGTFAVNPVNTDSSGVATATLNLTSVGTAVYTASCDGIYTTDNQTTWSITLSGDMQRSLIHQEDQVMHTEAYDDEVVGANTAAVAEPTTTTGTLASLENDMNVIRTIVRQMKSTASGTNWYDALGTYFDPTNTTSGSVANKDMSFTSISGSTLDAQTIILSVDAYNQNNGYTVSGTSTGVLLTLTGNEDYATPTNRLGLPIFASTANTGSYWDEGGLDRVCRINVYDVATWTALENTSGETIYAKFHDGADFGGSGDGVDVYARFYANGNPTNLTSVSGGVPSTVAFVYPFRKRVTDMADHEWHRTDFGNAFEDDIHFVNAISDLWSFTGAGNDVTSPTWTTTTSGYALENNPDNLADGADDLNDAIGDRDYLEENYVTDGEDVTTSIDELDMGLNDITELAAEGTGNKYITEESVDIPAETLVALPAGATYTPASGTGQVGKNMDVYLNGQLLAASTGVNGANADRDYAETTSSGITFHMKIDAPANITYVVRI